MAPSRSADLAKVVIRALIAGTITTCMTACIAGKTSITMLIL